MDTTPTSRAAPPPAPDGRIGPHMLAPDTLAPHTLAPDPAPPEAVAPSIARWNPIAGCTPLSPGCDRCAAGRMAYRLERMGGPAAPKYAGLAGRTASGRIGYLGVVRTDPAALDRPHRWRRPRRVVTAWMGDLFHEAVPDPFLARVLDVMRGTPQHVYEVTTKRPERALALAPVPGWPENLCLGVSVEDAARLGRVEVLRRIPVRSRFVEFAPLLGPIPPFPLEGIHEVRAGEEWGLGARPMRDAWVDAIAGHARAAGVPFRRLLRETEGETRAP